MKQMILGLLIIICASIYGQVHAGTDCYETSDGEIHCRDSGDITPHW